MVFYRKYRPQTISELDSSKLRETLTAVLSGKEIPHAFLLTGPKGLGKTSTARIIAKVVNCEHSRKSSVSSRSHDQLEPDNSCDQCVSITNGNNLDVLEIDGASNRGIDEIRDLRDKVKLAPSKAKKKIYIIDEVHMLTTEAFNALLKTIEEPPAHVMFIFCTTEPHKVPETIISRCFHVAFPKATIEDIAHSLERIVKEERLITIDKSALKKIAEMADGGFRDATKILEELILVAGNKKIDSEFIASYFKTTNINLEISDFLQYLFVRNTTGCVHNINQIVKQGTDIKWFISQLLTKLNEILLAQIGVQGDINTYPENLRFNTEDLKKLIIIFSEAYQQTKYAVITQLPLELAVIEWCSQSSPLEIVSMPVSPRNNIDTLRTKEKNLKVQRILKGSSADAKAMADKGGLKEVNNNQEELSDKDSSRQFMENLIYKVKPLNFSIAGVLRGCSLEKMIDGKVFLNTSYKFHKEKLSDIKTKQILEKAIREITGKDMQIMVELKS